MREQTDFLPQTCEAVLAEFGDSKSALVKATNGDHSGLTPRQSKILKYCTPSLLKGRPLGSTVIFMAGQSGAGKSSTINALFADPTLCATSSQRSETKDAVMFRKKLSVTKEVPPVGGNLSFVDVPGTFDTDNRNEATNVASIKAFREYESSLSSRAAYHSQIGSLMTGFSMRKTVYPNLVLFVIDATEKRLDGPDSFFRKSLQVMNRSNIVDTEHPNLIVVATNAMSIPIKKYRVRTEEICQTVRRIVEEELVVPNVPVVFVENEPEDNDMELAPETDFYQLPDGELSHENLIQEMFRVFKKTDDLLSTLFVSWYFNPNCPDRKLRAEAVTPGRQASTEEIESVIRELEVIRVPSGVASTPVFNFQSLGYGYCPVNEEVKHTNLLGAGLLETKEVVIQNAKFLIPVQVNNFIKNSSVFHRLSFQEREEYQNHMKASYGIEGSFKLIVQGSSNGRWINDSSGKFESSLVSLVQEIHVATFRLDNPSSAIKCPEFLAELRNLPKEYDGNTAGSYQAFFSRWGTHMVYEQAIGGSIQLDCTLESSHLNRQSSAEVEAKVSGIFSKCFSLGGSFNLDAEVKGLSAIGVTNEKLQIEGGNPPPLASLATLDPEQLGRWAESVVIAPTELKRNMKLYPYYNLLESGKGYEALRKATEETLNSTLEATIENATKKTREAISDQKTTEVITTEPNKCFPKGTKLTVLSEKIVTPKAIELLQKTDVLATLKTSDFLGHYIGKQTTTSFCTYLHVEREEMCQYLVLSFSNGKQLIVSPCHLIFWVKEGQVAAKQATLLNIGDQAIFMTNDQQVETPECTGILMERRLGAYAPLTYSGTFLADGFLVSSYADVDSFAVAQAALSPLKMWHKITSKLSKNKSTPVSEAITEDTPMQGIHPFAKTLIKARDILTFT